jgi:D-alanyl-D-alanine dipeptidase
MRRFLCKIILLVVALYFMSCSPKRESQSIHTTADTIFISKESVNKKNILPLEAGLVKQGLINVHELDASIRVSLHYATSYNFLHKPMYEGLQDCYLPCEVAIKLSNAQYYLKQDFPNYNIIVFDAVRPLHIQKQMWEELKMPAAQKINYLAHPSDISMHNYGAAVDVGIIGNNDVLLDMGTPFDFFGELSEPKKEEYFYKTGALSQKALANRLLLRKCMLKAGFTTITSEWWHFNSTSKTEAAKRYTLIQ